MEENVSQLFKVQNLSTTLLQAGDLASKPQDT